MDNKILLQNLAEALAARTGMTKRKADTFVRAFFDLAEEGLTTESILKIKGFATFKIVTVSDRESVNINTGERFQIIGHEKISFLPDNAFKELVNRPFNHFTTINLDDDFDISELDSVDGIGTEEGEETEEEQDFVEETETADEVLSDNNDAPTPTDDDRAATASDLKESEPQETADENVGEENPEISEEETNALMNEAQNLIDEAENKGTKEQAQKLTESLTLFSLLANVADEKSLIIHPASTTHSQLTEEELEKVNIHPTTIRISIGAENINDLIADFEQAFAKVFGKN